MYETPEVLIWLKKKNTNKNHPQKTQQQQQNNQNKTNNKKKTPHKKWREPHFVMFSLHSYTFK